MPQQFESSDADKSPRAFTADEQLLESPPPVERRLFTHTDPWRVLRIMGEFVEGFEELADVGPAVSIFGSSRASRDDDTFVLARRTAEAIGKEGFAIITGAGPGIMEAANQGARDAGVLSIGMNIELPHEQGTNPYLDRYVNFRYFFVRKTMLVKYSSAFVFFPGGFGTLDELFESLTLVQTGKIKDTPIALVGSAYWGPLMEWLQDSVAKEGYISADDLARFAVVDDPEEVARIVTADQSRHVTP